MNCAGAYFASVKLLISANSFQIVDILYANISEDHMFLHLSDGLFLWQTHTLKNYQKDPVGKQAFRQHLKTIVICNTLMYKLRAH